MSQSLRMSGPSINASPSAISIKHLLRSNMKSHCWILILALCLVIPDVHGWFWRSRSRRQHSSCGSHKKNGKPYYFGKTSLLCGKRGAPSRSTFELAHRFIFYDGWYYEFGIGSGKDVRVSTQPIDGNRCSSTENRPAGYGVISRECLKKCAQKYKSRHGKYRLFGNNGHHFANRMSAILCDSRSCPRWCE